MNNPKKNSKAKDTLLVIGNGFDLHLGLKTSYNDFFNWTIGKDEDDIPSHRKKARKNYLSFNAFYKAVKNQQGKVADEAMSRFTSEVHAPFWLLLFWLLRKETKRGSDIAWHKIEGVMTATVSPEGYEGFHWKKVYQFSKAIKKGDQITYDSIAAILAGIYCHLETGDIPVGYIDDGTYKSFARYFLRPHLYRFEKLFGRYITTVQLVNYDDYLEKAGLLIAQIVGERKGSYRKAPEKVYIDSFNYLDLSGWSLTSNSKGFTYIHGNSVSPIFGVARPNNPDDEAVCFTKAFLRPDPLCPAQEAPDEGRNIKEVHIYGHSLSKVDSPYFEALFEMMGLYDPSLCQHKKIYIDFSDVPGEDPKKAFEKRLSRLNRYLTYASQRSGHLFPDIEELMDRGIVVFRKLP
ncbi:MAG: AbiH family protein [Bacillota bacterium]|nr:AbiH family protein [Bacillota bacterium]